ncbi:MAG: 2-amino-4-hydroxy-6-hydroxymethyldihydropteridine diphosphokinase [Bacillota bacterium]
MSSTIAYIGLGSNQGDRPANLEKAVGELAAMPGVLLRRRAPVYETAPLGHTEQDWFLNTVVEVETTLPARELLERMLEIEKRLGRERGERWGPRVIDLDLLLFGTQTVMEPGLSVPHPRLAERAFAVVPLADLCPGLDLPDGGKASVLARRLVREQRLHRYAGDTPASKV